MSNLQLFKDGTAVVPAHLTAGIDETTKSLMGGGNRKRISVEGGVFRMMLNGKEVAQNTDRSMNVVIVRAAESNNRTFYGGQYKKGQAAAPDCWSDDTVTPHKDVKKPQSQSCATCPQNIKGSGQGDSRACRFSRRVAIALENDLEGDVYGLQLAATSVFGDDPKKMGIQQYARFLGGHGVSIHAVVTELRFDTDSSTPKLVFSAVRPLTKEQYDKVLDLKVSPAAVEAVTMTVSQTDGVKQTATADAPAQEPPPWAEQARAVEQSAASTGSVGEPTKRVTQKQGAASPVDVKSVLQQWADD